MLDSAFSYAYIIGSLQQSPTNMGKSLNKDHGKMETILKR